MKKHASLGSVMTEEAVLLSLIALAAVGGLALFGNGLGQFANNTQNGGNGTAGMATGNIPSANMPNQGLLYSASGPLGVANNFSNAYSNGPSGDSLYSWNGQTYTNAGYTFGGSSVETSGSTGLEMLPPSSPNTEATATSEVTPITPTSPPSSTPSTPVTMSPAEMSVDLNKITVSSASTSTTESLGSMMGVTESGDQPAEMESTIQQYTPSGPFFNSPGPSTTTSSSF